MRLRFFLHRRDPSCRVVSCRVASFVREQFALNGSPRWRSVDQLWCDDVKNTWCDVVCGMIERIGFLRRHVHESTRRKSRLRDNGLLFVDLVA